MTERPFRTTCRALGTGSVIMPPVLTRKALNRATLARQSLLERSSRPVPEMIERLVGLQAQTPHTAYVGLWTRLVDFRPEQLADRLVDRSVVRLALLRSTIHLVTARDAWQIRRLVQPVLDRGLRGQFGRRLEGIEMDELVARGRAFVDAEPRTFKALGDHLLERWPDRDRMALEQTVRATVTLIQVPPRGLWGRSGPVAHTSIETWLGSAPAGALSLDDLVVRYLEVFGPASVMDAQTWCGLTRLREVFERLDPGSPSSAMSVVASCSTCRTPHGQIRRRRPHRAICTTTRTCSCPTTTGRGPWTRRRSPGSWYATTNRSAPFSSTAGCPGRGRCGVSSATRCSTSGPSVASGRRS